MSVPSPPAPKAPDELRRGGTSPHRRLGLERESGAAVLMAVEQGYRQVFGKAMPSDLQRALTQLIDRRLQSTDDWGLAVRSAAALAEMSASSQDLAPDEVFALLDDSAAATSLSTDGSWLVAHHDRWGRPVVSCIRGGCVVRTLRSAASLARGYGEQRSTWFLLEADLPLGAIAKGSGRIGIAERARRMLYLDRRDIGVVVVYAVVSGALSLSTPAAVQALVSWVALGAMLQPLVVLTILLATFLVFDAVMRALQTWVVELIQQRVFARVATDLLRRLPRVAHDAEAGTDVTALSSRFLDVAIVQKSTATLLVDGLAIVLSVAVGSTLLTLYHPLLSLFAWIYILLIGVVVFAMGRGALPTADDESQAKYRISDFLASLSRPEFSLAGGASRETAQIHGEALTRAWLERRRDHFRITYRQHVASLAVHVLAAVALLGVGGALVIDAQLSLGQLVAAELVLAIMGSSAMKLNKPLDAAYDLAAAANKLGKLVDLKVQPAHADEDIAPGVSTLTVAQLSIRRGSADLRGLDLVARPGRHLWIDAEAGMGKSLLLDVMCRRLDPDSGQVQLGGLDLRLVDPDRLSTSMVLVRLPRVLGADLLDDLRWVAPSLSAQEAAVFLEVVGLAEVVRRFPEGLAVELAPGGFPLSRSQALRLTLARAMASRPKVILLDETLDALGLSPEQIDHLASVLFAPDAPWVCVSSGRRPTGLNWSGDSISLTADGTAVTSEPAP